MKVRFWGTRGSIAVSGEQYRGTGGNTSCVEVEHDGYRLILDGGTGLRSLGDSLGFGPLEATLVFSHFHWDHIQGVPFFMPAYNKDSALTFVGVKHELGLREALERQMRPPNFPVEIDLLAGVKRYADIATGVPFHAGPFTLTAVEQPHPNGVAAYRIEADGRSLVYATDVEHGGETVDARLVDAARDTDLLIHDAQYHWAEYTGVSGPPRKGWGHSTWLEAVLAAQRSGAQRLALFHHDPARDDQGVEDMESLARERFPEAFAAREGQVVTL